MRSVIFTLLLTLNLLSGDGVYAQLIQATSAPGSYQIRGGSAQAARVDYALLIANDTFTDPAYRPLTNPTFDAREIEALLRDKFGFRTTLLANVTKDSCVRQIRRLASQSYGPYDQLFIFFAGHGDFDPVLQQGYAVMTNSKAGDDGYTNHLSFAYLQDLLAKFRCRHVLLTLDVCYGGTFDSYFATQNPNELKRDGPERGVRADVEELGGQTPFILTKLKPQTRKYLTSGGKETVADGEKGKHSPFARFFIQKLNEAAGSDYRILPASDLKSYIERQSAITRIGASVKMGSFGSDESNSEFLFIAR
ncbi:caspase family protein [Spirosoma sp. 209]|uniref:caspase family protein n=1 Tax=Spirosoma sp. 209 TaxID=1955701 RepID=UPI00098D4321|nr:caspase family protein [Spirosoma sp. 209]